MERVVVVGGGVLDAAGVRQVNPALRGVYSGGLRCAKDAIVEPQQVPGEIRDHLQAGGAAGGYAWLPGREAASCS